MDSSQPSPNGLWKELIRMNDSAEHGSKGFGLVGFDHVTLVVASVADSRKFYVDQLGFEEVTRPAFSFLGAWFKIGQTLIHIVETNELAGKAGWGDRTVERASRGHHIAYRTIDFEHAVQAIGRCKIEVASGPKIRPDGTRQIFIYDPDRHLIEICS